MISDLELLKQHIRDIPDFPKPGIVFKDITPLLQDGQSLRLTIDRMAELVQEETIHIVASPEARGFIFGPALAYRLGCGYVPIRKPDKLPFETTSVAYDLEYGQDSVEVHTDGIHPGDRVLLVDDVLATGGTMSACTHLVEKLGGIVVRCIFLMELTALHGRTCLKDYLVQSLIEG